jgi:hypothetical protein
MIFIDIFYLQSAIIEGWNVFVWVLEMQVGGDDAALHGDQGFGDGAEAGGGLRVAHVGFDRADQQRGVSSLAEDVGDRVDLLRVANFGAGAVGLDVDDVRGTDACFGVRLQDESLLDGAGRVCDTLFLVSCNQLKFPIKYGYKKK